jgi:hypothetical protein
MRTNTVTAAVRADLPSTYALVASALLTAAVLLAHAADYAATAAR